MSILIILFKIIMVLIVIAVVAFAAIQAVYWLNLDNKIMFLLYKIFNKISMTEFGQLVSTMDLNKIEDLYYPLIDGEGLKPVSVKKLEA